ncbi:MULTISPECIES: DUF1697 domain-containing protein [Gordonia]|uniref:DUF1697 domain-containing protein n=1 Tax=Gordonia terrae C-6 TaxID=1316928 RepID=R7Y585_9ACTN|nr:MULTISPECIES: DUF1697 domain-containing protein [Gordonia]AFR51154.1 hypothetical protein KTR9_4550 [Gordonia sp. KTR9]EON30864.1 hypothetical protein GTC6_20375 [Gordonia terrae C-6]
MSRRIVLIRAVNVGGAKLPMAELRQIATDLGADEVTTYIASGNLICSPPPDPDEFDRALETAMEERYGWFREVISRTTDQVRAALDAHPFDIVDDKYSYVYFLTGEPAPDKVTAFERKDFGEDVVRVIGSDLHIRYADGAGRSTLTAPVIARGLGVQGTGRNLRTVRKLLELAGS